LYNCILVPLDGSKRAERILPYVEKLALTFGSKVVFLQVVETAIVYATEYSYYIDPNLDIAGREKLWQEAEVYLKGLQGEFHQKGIQAKILVADGPVVRIIIHVAEKENADLIAMASHGHTGLARVFYGSVAAGILHQADRRSCGPP